ncbi:MAG: ADP-ribosylglycohydrolase family protein, partial [Gammaproteobacteria bacterium]|nr:ADP-ribosylglycohydrolase family protein [Gammaproteobacteria bacterium]
MSTKPTNLAPDRFRGALVGLAVGDALGTTLEFQRPGTFAPISDMTGGGPFGLDPGKWTDDTSLALCLADSLVQRQRFDPKDQIERYARWRGEGLWSSTGNCFDIGNTTSAALDRFEQTGEPYSGPAHERSAGNGSVMRLAPVPMFFARDAADAVHYSGQSSR